MALVAATDTIQALRRAVPGARLRWDLHPALGEGLSLWLPDSATACEPLTLLGLLAAAGLREDGSSELRASFRELGERLERRAPVDAPPPPVQRPSNRMLCASCVDSGVAELEIVTSPATRPGDIGRAALALARLQATHGDRREELTALLLRLAGRAED
jgi:hypothetical protein